MVINSCASGHMETLHRQAGAPAGVQVGQPSHLVTSMCLKPKKTLASIISMVAAVVSAPVASVAAVDGGASVETCRSTDAGTSSRNASGDTP